MARRWEDLVRSFYSKILPLVITLAILATLLFQLFPEVPFMMHLLFIAFIVFAFYQLGLSKDIKDILEERLPVRSSSNPCSDNNEREERIETSGGGALAGMVAGAAIGLLLGPAGVIIGGILGALAGNQLEYESIRAERERRRRVIT